MLRGGPNGVTTTRAKARTQNAKGVPSTSEASDHFGRAVQVALGEGLFGGQGEDGWKGRVRRLPTGTDGVTATGNTSFNLTALAGPAESAHFGEQLSG